MLILTLFVALGCGLNAGIFYAFSSFVMRALGNLTPADGARAMQRINLDVINPWFMLVFMGTPALCVVLIGLSVADPGAAGAGWRIAAAAVHLLGCFFVTMVFNVPLNNRLAKLDPETAEAAALWRHYRVVWTRWNTVRTVTPLASLAMLLLAMAG